MNCKSCHAPLAEGVSLCTSCGIANPKSMNARSKKWLLAAAVGGVILIVIIPMVASLLWMQSK